MPNTDNQPDKVTSAAQALLEKLKAAKGTETKPEVVAAVRELANDASLTPSEKQQAFMQVTRVVVGSECDAAANDPGTLLRGKGVETQFLAAYMELHAQEYKDAVVQETAQKIAELRVPERGFTKTSHPDSKLDAQNIPLPGMRSDAPDVNQAYRKDLDSTVQQEWDDLYECAAKIIVDANNNHIDKLSPEAQEFLQTCAEVTQEKYANHPKVDTIVATLTANNVNLRLTAPAVSMLRSTSDDPTIKAAQNTIFTRGSQVAQAYINKFDLDSVTVTRESENILVNIREDQELREKTLAASQAACSGNAATYQPAQLDLRQQAAPNYPEPVVSVSVNQPAQSSKHTSVRDALRGAVGKIQDAAHDLGTSIKIKIEQVKLDRLEKQVEKRQGHINNVQSQKTFVGEVKQMFPKERQQLMADLQAKVDPELLLKGSRQERAAQMQLMDQIEVCKMSPEKLDQHADKLQERLDKNEEKLGRLEQKRDAQKAKVDLRTARHANAQQQPQQARGHGH